MLFKKLRFLKELSVKADDDVEKEEGPTPLKK